MHHTSFDHIIYVPKIVTNGLDYPNLCSLDFQSEYNLPKEPMPANTIPLL